MLAARRGAAGSLAAAALGRAGPCSSVALAPRGPHGSSARSRAHLQLQPQQQRLPGASSSAAARAPGRPARRGAVRCRAADEQPGKSVGLPGKFNPVYLVIFGAYASLLAFRNPYIYAVLTVLTILPQNSNVTSLNNLVLLFYESGLFQNFAEAVNCVRLVTWLSMGFMVASFALFK